MGGEGGVETTVPASLQALQQNPDLHLILVGDEQRLQPCLHAAAVELRSRYTVVHSAKTITDLDNPRDVLRSSRDSSLFMATELVQKGEVQAMVSAGNTGAMLMAGRHLLKTIPGIQKPAIVATIPGARQQSYLLDVGANPQCDAQQLFEFAVMGTVLAESLGGRNCTVGLLNIGEEQYKGTEEVRAAADMLEACEELDYIGFVEANALFEGVADVVVCDGFVGNVTIKSSAGVANVIKNLLAAQVEESLLTRLSGLSSTSILSRLTEQINPQRFNGASLLGLQGSMVKSHGNATMEGFFYAIQQAVREVEQAVPQLIADRVAAIMAANNQNT
jgi:glycerol-3-phosphate acyltransferase PlsX